MNENDTERIISAIRAKHSLVGIANLIADSVRVYRIADEQVKPRDLAEMRRNTQQITPHWIDAAGRRGGMGNKQTSLAIKTVAFLILKAVIYASVLIFGLAFLVRVFYIVFTYPIGDK